ncbi:MAG: amidohydrolase family protein [Candidatus Izemoplasmatales bacterium]|nr:amidohydrolase family protein [Candidatus Izemoplasmatales bacterium]
MYSIINAKIYDYKNYLDNGYLIFDDFVVEVGKMINYINKNYSEIDVSGNLVIPGFVTGHTHLYSTFARGLNLEFNPKNFVEILEQLWWKVDRFLDKDMIYYSALMGGLDQLKMGTTTLIDHHASFEVDGSLETIKKALNDRLGLRSILAFEVSDRFNVKKGILENVNYIKNHQNSITTGLMGMHASLSLSDASLIKIKDDLDGNGIHIHVAESLMDEEECIKNYGMRVVERLEKFGLLNDKALLVHCTHINEVEMDIIKKYNATIAVNVTSNLNNAVGISQIKKFLDKGIRVISGNDGLIPSQAMEYLNIYYLSHLKTASPIGFSLEDLKSIINNTYDYTNMLLGTNLGVFKKGSEADILIVDYKPFTLMNENNVFGHIFFGVYPGLKPKSIFASGKLLIDNYQFIENYDNSYKEALLEANKLWEKLEKEGKKIEFKY